jgi:hypothetical protein
MNTIDEKDLIYLAGFVDGDGSIIAKFIYHKDYVKTRPYQISLTVQATQKTKRKWFLEKIKKIIGEGNVNDRKSVTSSSGGGNLEVPANTPPGCGARALPRRGGVTDVSDYCLVGPAAVGKFLKQIQPYLRLKQKQANLVIRITEQLPYSHDPEKFYELCQLVDQVSALNDSKNRTITADIVMSRMKEALKEIVPVETEE